MKLNSRTSHLLERNDIFRRDFIDVHSSSISAHFLVRQVPSLISYLMGEAFKLTGKGNGRITNSQKLSIPVMISTFARSMKDQ